MSVSVERLEHNLAKLTIEIPAEEVAAAEERAYQKNRSKINIPGFRKGKAPKKMIENMYGADVFMEDAVNDLLPDAYEEACNESGLEIMSRPEIDYKQVEHGKAIIVDAVVAVKPEVKLGEYKGLHADVEEPAVTEEELTARLKEEQEKNAAESDVEGRPVKEGDTVHLDYAGTIDGVPFEGGTAQDQELVIGSHSFIEGFEEQMVGMNIGEEKDLNVTFPEAYHAAELAGKPAVFHVKVNAISEKILPELDDEFASEVSEFETLDAYKESLKEEILKSKQELAKTEKENKLLEKAVENAEMDIPDMMIESQAEDLVRDFGQRLEMQGLRLEQYLQYTGMTMPQMVEQYKEQAKKRIQGRLVLEAIAKAEGLEATEEDLENEYKKMAEQYSMEVEKVKEYMGSQEDGVKEDLATQKALDLLVAEAK
ncbi:MAG: trigger factor [Lachnospiraceae bacterium]|nr:trigger factor [Lachnospiraceae bacterium]